jgi:hypothetical protein
LAFSTPTQNPCLPPTNELNDFMMTKLLQDRATALNDPLKYKKTLSVGKQRIYLLLYWMISLAVPAVLAAGLLKSFPFPDRYSCQVGKHYISFGNKNMFAFINHFNLGVK